MPDPTPEQIEEARTVWSRAIEEPDDTEFMLYARACARIAELEAENERLSTAIRQTHTNYCTEAWTDRGLHAPECLLYELESPDAYQVAYRAKLARVREVAERLRGRAKSPGQYREAHAHNLACDDAAEGIEEALDGTD